MKILIVEDETTAYENLVEILAEVAPEAEVLDNTESIRQTVRWLQSHPKPDLILMDIHLSDGSSFAIFEHTEVESPIIFTTAYDQYAIDAFKVNSIGASTSRSSRRPCCSGRIATPGQAGDCAVRGSLLHWCLYVHTLRRELP